MIDTDDAPTYDLLDVIVVIAENWKLLFFVPVILSALAFSIAQGVGRQWAATVSVPALHDVRTDRTPDAYLFKMTTLYPKLAIGKADGQYHLKAVASSGKIATEQVQEATGNLAGLLKAGVGEDIDRLNARIENLRSVLAQTSSDKSPVNQTIIAYALVTVTKQMEDLVAERDALLLSQTELSVQPEIATLPQGPSPTTIAITTAVLAMIVIGAFLALRFVWEEIRKNPKNFVRINRIRKAFYFRPRT